MGRASFHTVRMKANPRVRALVSRVPSLAAISTSVLAALLAGCVPPPPSIPAPGPSAAPPPPQRPAPAPPRPAADWRDAPITPGNWTYATSPGGSVASFGGGLFTMRCNPQTRAVILVRAATQGATPASLSITTSNLSRTLNGSRTGAGIEASVSARDPLLDAMALSRGRFVISAAGEQTLYLPSWTEVTRVVEDCR